MYLLNTSLVVPRSRVFFCLLTNTGIGTLIVIADSVSEYVCGTRFQGSKKVYLHM